MHEGGWKIEAQDGAFVFIHPSGKVMPPTGLPLPVTERSIDELAEANRAAGLEIDPGTCVPGWLGERPDWSIALDSLIWHDRRGIPSA